MFLLSRRSIRKNLPRIGRFRLQGMKVLALESSCDDSCVALIEKDDSTGALKIIDHIKKTLNSTKTGGIVPTDAHEFHQQNLGVIVQKICKRHNVDSDNPPDIVCCTRGPGMMGSLSASLQLAKGLAIAWNRPLVGVHHMLGHILISKLPTDATDPTKIPQYPFLSLLCSGGHTMLVLSRSIIDHEVIINTCDIAVGDAIDKCAREIGLVGNILGKELEQYVNSIPIELREKFKKIDTNSKDNEFNFQLKLPMKGTKQAKIPTLIEFSFSSFLSVIQGYKKQLGVESFDEYTKMFVAYKLQNVIFDHIVDRVNVALRKHGVVKEIYNSADGKLQGVKDFICSGGVASNILLRQKLSNNADTASLSQAKEKFDFEFYYPDIELCTDNAIMIGLVGIEFYESLHLSSDISMLPIRKWPLNEILSVDSWVKVI